jgi:hypothetical protein
MGKQILLVGGSLNQTKMMHKVAAYLGEHDCFFSPFFDDGLLGDLSQNGWLDFTILGGQHRRNSEAYMNQNGLAVDFGGRSRSYDLVITGTDLIVPKRFAGQRMVLIQEGMMEPEGAVYQLVRALRLPRFLANTAATGLSNAYDLFCVASPGYRDIFIRKGIRPEKIAITGIPNFDDVQSFCKNDFPLHHFVLAATSSHRETFHFDNREAFIRRAQAIAKGRTLIFKLHPNENISRARREILQIAPEALIYESGNINPMIANCDVLITQTSSVTFIGLALGKEVYSDLDLAELKRLIPIQNKGASASLIADQCQKLLLTPAHHSYHPVSTSPVYSQSRAGTD